MRVVRGSLVNQLRTHVLTAWQWAVGEHTHCTKMYKSLSNHYSSSSADPRNNHVAILRLRTKEPNYQNIRAESGPRHSVSPNTWTHSLSLGEFDASIIEHHAMLPSLEKKESFVAQEDSNSKLK